MSGNLSLKNNLPQMLEEVNLSHLPFPENVGQLLTMRGFGNIEALVLIDDSDIKKIEKFARQTLPELLTPEESDTFFGVYSRKPQLFEIGEGDLRLLKLVQNACQNFITKSKFGKSQQKRNCSDKRHGRSGVKSDQESLSAQRSDRGSDHIPSLSEEKKSSIQIHVRHVATDYIKKYLRESKKREELMFYRTWEK